MPRSVPEAAVDAILARSEVTTFDHGKTTIVHLHLPSGFEIVESASCVDPDRYDSSIGYETAMRRLKDRVWELEGYRAHFES